MKKIKLYDNKAIAVVIIHNGATELLLFLNPKFLKLPSLLYISGGLKY